MNRQIHKGIFLAVLAAALYAISTPFSKLLLNDIPPTIMAGLLYLGAGISMVCISVFRKMQHKASQEARLTKEELPFTLAMVILDVIAPICLMVGLGTTTAANASLLNNFEIVATAIIALMVFRESISPRLWLGILFVTLSCALLSFEDISSLRFSFGSLLVLLAAVLWGFENNCTRKISSKDPLQIVLLKGVFSGGTSVCIGLYLGERVPAVAPALIALTVGFFAYGIGIYVYVYAQRFIGAARTSAYYAIAPFISAALSMVMLRESPDILYLAALLLMIVGAWLSSSDEPLSRAE